MGKTSGKITMERCGVICPFCLKDTKRWKIIKAVWKWNTEHTCLEPEEIDRTEAKAWEQTVLQEHLAKCKMRNYISNSVLEHYGLIR